MMYFIVQCKQIYDRFVKDEVTVYAAQASFFIVLSAFPFIMLLISIIQVVPAVSHADLLRIVTRIFPLKVLPLIETILEDLYSTSPAAILSVTTVVTLWSASRGMLGIERGLNRIAGCSRRRNYVLSRIINSGYTVVFIAVCVMSLGLLVFGSSIQNLFLNYFPFLNYLSTLLVSLRTLLALGILIIFFMGLYTFLPYERLRLRYQLPGAIFSTVSWVVFSFGFSIYFSHFSRFSYMYGSLAAVVILMLWLYFCICILFLGAELNQHLMKMHWFKK